MGFTKDEATAQAKRDLAKRLNVDEHAISASAVVAKDLPDRSLGASVGGERGAQWVSSGWQINLEADGKPYEYRADKYQLRLVDFKGRNHVVE